MRIVEGDPLPEGGPGGQLTGDVMTQDEADEAERRLEAELRAWSWRMRTNMSVRGKFTEPDDEM